MDDMDEPSGPSERAQSAMIIGAFLAVGVIVMGLIYLADKSGASSVEEPKAAAPIAPTPAEPTSDATQDETADKEESFGRVGMLGVTHEPLLEGWIDCSWSTSVNKLKDCAPDARKREDEKRTRFTSLKTRGDTLYLIDYYFEDEQLNGVIVSSMSKTSSDNFPYYSDIFEHLIKIYGYSFKVNACKTKDPDSCKTIDHKSDKAATKLTKLFGSGDILSFTWILDDEMVFFELQAESKIIKSGKQMPDIPIHLNFAIMRQ